MRLALKKMEDKHGTEVIYLRGNHDDLPRRFLPLRVSRLRVVEEFVHRGMHRDYQVVHGDVFDIVTRRSRWLAMLADVGCQMLLSLNRLYNRWRTWRGVAGTTTRSAAPLRPGSRTL